MEGEPFHRHRDHAPCVKCACRNVAGEGTDHLGWGYCSDHEKKYGVEKSEAVEVAHRNQLISKNPGVYRDLDAYSRHVMDKMAEGEQALGVMEELGILRGVIQELISKGRGADDNGNQLMEYVGQEGVQRPISDKTRIELFAKLLPQVNQFMRTEQKMREKDTIDVSQFEVWFGRFYSCLTDLGRALDNGEISSGSNLLERFKESMRELGDPRGMKGRKQ